MRITASKGILRANPMTSYALTWPTETWGSRNCASEAASTMSASATKCSPPPAHTPFTAVMTGFATPQCQAVMRSSARRVRPDCLRRASG